MEDNLVSVIIGFIGGIFGGILVQIASIKFRIFIEKREKKKTDTEKYWYSLRSKLKEIIGFIDREFSTDINRPRIQNQFSIYSNQLNSILSNYPESCPNNLEGKFKEIGLDLHSVSTMLLHMGNGQEFCDLVDQVKNNVANLLNEMD